MASMDDVGLSCSTYPLSKEAEFSITMCVG